MDRSPQLRRPPTLALLIVVGPVDLALGDWREAINVGWGVVARAFRCSLDFHPRHYDKLTFSIVRRETQRGRLPARMID